MAEGTQQGSSAAATGAAAPPAQPGGSDASAPQMSAQDIAELNELRRLRQQFDGSRALAEAAVKAGAKTPEDIKKLVAASSRLNEFEQTSTISLEALMNSMAQPDAGAAQAAGFSKEELASYLKENGYLTTAEADRRAMAAEHNRSLESLSGLLDEHLTGDLLKEFYGDNANDFAKATLRDAVESRLHRLREAYPDDHPLREEYGFAPPSKATVERAINELKESHVKAMGSKMDAAATAAAGGKQAPKSGTPAGNVTGQGKEPPDDSNDDDNGLSDIASGLLDKAAAAGGGV